MSPFCSIKLMRVTKEFIDLPRYNNIVIPTYHSGPENIGLYQREDNM